MVLLMTESSGGSVIEGIGRGRRREGWGSDTPCQGSGSGAIGVHGGGRHWAHVTVGIRVVRSGNGGSGVESLGLGVCRALVGTGDDLREMVRGGGHGSGGAAVPWLVIGIGHVTVGGHRTGLLRGDPLDGRTRDVGGHGVGAVVRELRDLGGHGLGASRGRGFPEDLGKGSISLEGGGGMDVRTRPVVAAILAP